jgi:hypothetical protein
MIITVLNKITSEPQQMDLDVTSIVLKDNGDNRLRMFFCFNCQNPVMQYVGGRVTSVTPGAVPSVLPQLIQCSNRSCRTKYLFERIVARKML